MKIGAPTAAERSARSLFGQPTAPLLIDDLGCCKAVIQAPTTDEAWAALTERLPRNGAYAAARLTACLSRVDTATADVAKGLRAIGERRRAGEPVPSSWIDRLADLIVEEYDALVCLDDAAHDGAICPAWVEVPAGERPVPSTEQSWVRCARLVARAIQVVPGDGWSDAVFDALALIDPYREGPGTGEVERITTACRDAVRLAIRASYSTQETRT